MAAPRAAARAVPEGARAVPEGQSIADLAARSPDGGALAQSWGTPHHPVDLAAIERLFGS